MKCKHCDGCGYVWINGEKGECGACQGTGEYMEETNDEWFSRLTVGNKAKLLSRVSFCDFCPYQLTEYCTLTDGDADCFYGQKDNEECWEAWLKEVHKE